MALETKNIPLRLVQRIGKLSSDGVFVYDLGRNQLMYLNSSLVRIVEITKKLLIEEPALILKTVIKEDQDYIMMRLSELLEKEILEDIQIRLGQNKHQKIVSCNCYLTADRNYVIGFVKDITKLKEHEDFLIDFGARKDALLDMVSQRLSTPLNLSKFTVDLFQKAVEEKKYDKLNTHIKLMREVTSDCIQFISDFMKEEHMESPDIHPKSNRFDAISKILVVLEKIKQSNTGKKFKFQTPANHLFINGDDVKFFQIIHNVLSNAVKFTKPNGEIETNIKNHKDKIEIVISDNGIGIPEKLQPYIFEKNTRAARPGLKGEKSNGIGLYVCKKLAELMGGRIGFESQENKGSKFVMEFPKT
jgi:two-component system sensor histidine kinase VicK